MDVYQAYDLSRQAILELQRYEQFTEDEAIKIFKKKLGCNGKQAKKAWKKMKDNKKGGAIYLGDGIYRLRKESEINLEDDSKLSEMVETASNIVELTESKLDNDVEEPVDNDSIENLKDQNNIG